MTRIEYFNSELSKNKGYEYDMSLVAMMTESEKCECFNLDPEDIADLEQIISDFYSMREPETESEAITPNWGGLDPAFSSLADYYRMRY